MNEGSCKAEVRNASLKEPRKREGLLGREAAANLLAAVANKLT